MRWRRYRGFVIGEQESRKQTLTIRGAGLPSRPIMLTTSPVMLSKAKHLHLFLHEGTPARRPPGDPADSPEFPFAQE